MGGFEGDRVVVFPQSLVLLRRHEGRVAKQGDQNHSTRCLYLQRFVESERDVLNSLFLTSRSTFVLHGIPLSESLLVASSILCIPFFLRARAFYSSARVPRLCCNCHHGSSIRSSLDAAQGGRMQGILIVGGHKLHYVFQRRPSC